MAKFPLIALEVQYRCQLINNHTTLHTHLFALIFRLCSLCNVHNAIYCFSGSNRKSVLLALRYFAACFPLCASRHDVTT